MLILYGTISFFYEPFIIDSYSPYRLLLAGGSSGSSASAGRQWCCQRHRCEFQLTFEKRQCPLWKSTTWLLVVIKTIGHRHSWHRKWPGAGRRWWARHRYTKYGTELRAIFLFEKSKTWIHVKNRPVAPPAQEVVGLPEGTDELRTLYLC